MNVEYDKMFEYLEISLILERLPAIAHLMSNENSASIRDTEEFKTFIKEVRAMNRPIGQGGQRFNTRRGQSPPGRHNPHVAVAAWFGATPVAPLRLSYVHSAGTTLQPSSFAMISRGRRLPVHFMMSTKVSTPSLARRS